MILADQSSKCWESPSFSRFIDKDQGEITLCRGDLSSYSNGEMLTEKLYAWSKSKDQLSTPKSIEHASEMHEFLTDLEEETDTDWKLQTYFPTSYALAEKEEKPAIDAILSQEDENYNELDLPDVDKMFEVSEEQ